MKNVRLIARLDVKGPNLVKGVQLEGLRKLGDPNAFARRYYEAGIDEIVYVDIVASLYERNSLHDIIRGATQDVFIPITVGGGLRKIDDVRQVLRAGADKVAINTAALARPELIKEVAETFGSQCMVLSVQAKRTGDGATGTSTGKWEPYYDNGREHSHRDLLEWVQEATDLGAGEILLMSVDQEGTARGMDLELIEQVSTSVNIPVIAGGGIGKLEDIGAAVKQGQADAVAMAHVLHYDKLTVPEVRQYALEQGIHVRKVEAQGVTP